MDHFQEMLRELAISLSEDETKGLTTYLIVLDLGIDTVNQRGKNIPQDKVDE